MLLKDILPIAVAAGLALPSAVNAQASPTLIPLQARLTDQSGEPYVDGRYTLTFNLYTEPVGGATQWTERHEQVGVVDGMINLFLGSIEPLPPVRAEDPSPDFFSTTRYLGITIDADNLPSTADPEMVPRQLIIPAFHAKTAESSRNAESLAGHSWRSLLAGNSNNPSTGVLRDNILGADAVGTSELKPNAVTFTRVASRSVVSSTGGIGAIVFGEPFAGESVAPNTQSVQFEEHAVEIETRGAPVLVSLQGGQIVGKNPQEVIQGFIYFQCWFIRKNLDTGETIGLNLGSEQASDTAHVSSPASAYRHIDIVPAGRYRYTLQLSTLGSNVKVEFEDSVQMLAFEL